MTMYGYNFNSVSTLAHLLRIGYLNVTGTGPVTTPLLPWNNRCYDLNSGLGASDHYIQTPQITDPVRYVRQKICFQRPSRRENVWPILFCSPDAGYQMAVGLSYTPGRYYIYRGSSVVETIDLGNDFDITPDAAFNLEAYLYVDSTNGFLKLYRNGVLIHTFTGNTKNSSTYNTVGYGGCRNFNTEVSDAHIYVHDIIIDNAPTDTMIGNQYVMTQRPASTISASSDITTSDSSAPYVVLAHTYPGGTPYVQMPAAGDVLEVSFTSLPVNVASINAMKVTVDWSKATDSSYGAGDVTSRLDFTVGSTAVTGTAQALSNGYTSHSENLTQVISLSDANAMTATITRTV